MSGRLIRRDDKWYDRCADENIKIQKPDSLTGTSTFTFERHDIYAGDYKTLDGDKFTLNKYSVTCALQSEGNEFGRVVSVKLLQDKVNNKIECHGGTIEVFFVKRNKTLEGEIELEEDEHERRVTIKWVNKSDGFTPAENEFQEWIKTDNLRRRRIGRTRAPERSAEERHKQRLEEWRRKPKPFGGSLSGIHGGEPIGYRDRARDRDRHSRDPYATTRYRRRSPSPRRSRKRSRSGRRSKKRKRSKSKEKKKKKKKRKRSSSSSSSS